MGGIRTNAWKEGLVGFGIAALGLLIAIAAVAHEDQNNTSRPTVERSVPPPMMSSDMGQVMQRHIQMMPGTEALVSPRMDPARGGKMMHHAHGEPGGGAEFHGGELGHMHGPGGKPHDHKGRPR